MKNGNWIALRKNITRHLPRSRPFTVLEATYSLTVDFDNGESVHSVSGYASLWRWTRRRVSKFLNDCGLEIDSKSKKPGRLKRKNNDSETAHQTAQKQHIGLLVFSKAYETTQKPHIQQLRNSTHL